MVEIISVRFKNGGKQYYFNPNGEVFQPGEGVIVETSRGVEYGECTQGNTPIDEMELTAPLRPVLRRATQRLEEGRRARGDRLEELRREDPLPPPEQDREQSKARVLAGVKRQLRRKKLCFSARVLAGAAALGVAVWLLVFRFQTPIPYSQDIRIQEVEPAFHMKYLGRDYAGLWTRYLSPGSPYHESVGINNGIVLDTRHGTVIPLPFDGGADQVWYLAGDLEELEDLDEASFQAQAGDAVLLWERQG